MSREQVIDFTRKQVKQHALTLVKHIIKSATELEQDLQQDRFTNLGGSLQNIWELFWKLGELNILGNKDYFIDQNK